MKKPDFGGGEYQYHYDAKNYSYGSIRLDNVPGIAVPAIHVMDLQFFSDSPRANIVIDGPVFLAPAAPPYYHMLVDVVGEYEFLKFHYPDVKIVFCSNDNFNEFRKQTTILNTDYCQEIINTYDSEYRIIDVLNNNVHFKHVIYFPTRSMWGQDRIVPLAIQDAAGNFDWSDCVDRRKYLIGFIKNKLLWHKSDKVYPEKIYSARIDVDSFDYGATENNPRLYKDEVKVIEYFKGLGFEILNLDKMSFRDQVAAFSGAKQIAGLAGSNLFNSIFASPGTDLYEIHVTNLWAYTFFEDYYNVSGLELRQICKEYVRFMDQDSLNYVPVEKIISVLDQVYKV